MGPHSHRVPLRTLPHPGSALLGLGAPGHAGPPRPNSAQTPREAASERSQPLVQVLRGEPRARKKGLAWTFRGLFQRGLSTSLLFANIVQNVSLTKRELRPEWVPRN